MKLIYKILLHEAWQEALKLGVFSGSAVDLADGYIHFSDSLQAEETAARHFAGQTGLVIAAFDAGRFGPALRWEPSRGGALFPHLYALLNPADAIWVKALPWNGSSHEFPAGWKT